MKNRFNPIFRHHILATSLVLCLGQPANAADILWSGALTGTLDWNTGSNWTGGSFVNSTTDRADLRADWASTPVINLSGPVAVNGILFNDTGSSGDTTLTIGNGGTAANTLTLGGTSPSIEVLSTTLTISANLVGSSGFTKSSSGVLVLSGSNTEFAGSVIVSGGTLRFGSTSALNSGSLVQLNSGTTLNVNNSNTIAGLNDNAGAGGSVTNSSGGGKVLTIGGSGSYSFNGSFSGNASGTKVGLVVSGTATQVLGGDNTGNIGYQSVTGNGATLVFAKQNSIFQGLSTGAVVNANQAANSGINVSLGGTVALGVGDASSGFFDATAIATFLDGTHMGASSSSTGFRNSSIFGFDTTNATGGTFTYSTALTNIGSSTGIGFAKLGAGTLVIDAANTYTGGTQVRAGTLQLGSGGTSGSIASTADITVSSGATLAFNRSDTGLAIANKITGAGGVSQTGSGQTSLDSTSNDFSGPISISGGILQVKSVGNGTVTLSGAAKQFKLNSSTSYSNAIDINGATGVTNQGVIDTATGINATLSGPITITASPTNGGHFGTSATGSVTFSGTITSSVPVVFRRGTGIFSGGGSGYTALQVRADTVKLGAHNGLATTATVALGGDGAATLDLVGYNQSLVGITKGLNSATITNSGTSDSTLTLTGTSNFAGVIQDGATNKTGVSVSGGSLTLGGANTYTGATSVSGGGTLIISGSLSTTAVSVGSGSTISGIGTIGGQLTVDSGGFLAPGSSPGNLTLGGGLDLAGTYLWELGALSSANPGSDFDMVTVTSGDVDLTGAALGLNLGTFAPSPVPFWQTNQTWTGIINNTGLGSLTGSFAAIDNSAWASLGSFTTTYSGNDVNLVWTAVPEPRSATGVGILGMILLLGRRRCRARN